MDDMRSTDPFWFAIWQRSPVIQQKTEELWEWFYLFYAQGPRYPQNGPSGGATAPDSVWCWRPKQETPNLSLGTRQFSPSL